MSTITPIGMTDWRNQHQVFGIKEHDRLGHIYCIGKTGTGKSTLLLNMAIADIERGNGIGIIDPHGDLAEEILNYIPQERIKDVVYFNTCDIEYPIAFNPLSGTNDQNRYLIVAGIVTALKKLWSENWGPRLEHILRFTLLSLSYYSQSTLLDIVPMLTNKEFRQKVLYAVSEHSIKEFWQKEFEPLPPQLKQEFIAPIINKVGLFSAHPIVRNIIGQVQSKIDIARIMDTKKIFIANLSKGMLGETGTELLGSLLVSQFQTAALARAIQPIQARIPFYLFIDEAHSFITKSFVDILSEARKYGLALFLTHQFIDQLPEDLQKAILGNVGTLISFRVGTKDAKILAEEFYPVFKEEDLINLPRYHIYLKLLIDGTTSKPFSGISVMSPRSKNTHKNEIIEFSRSRHAILRDIIKDNIELSQKYYEINNINTKTLFHE